MGASATDEALFHNLTARYSEPHRKYHTLQHLDECFERLAEIKHEAANPEDFEFALWFHDAIYDTKRQAILKEILARENLARSVRQLGG